MNDVNSILIVADEIQPDFQDALFDLGLTPLLRSNMQNALTKIRHERCRAILFYSDHIRIDALEFILNVRDIDEDVPIFILYAEIDQTQSDILSKQKNVTVLEEALEEVSSDLKEIFKTGSGR